jgi:hypothetical protein
MVNGLKEEDENNDDKIDYMKKFFIFLKKKQNY